LVLSLFGCGGSSDDAVSPQATASQTPTSPPPTPEDTPPATPATSIPENLRGQWDTVLAYVPPFYSGPYILLGKVYTKKGQPVTAEAMLRRAIGFDPNNRVAHYLLGQVLQQMGREDEAKREFAIAEQLQQAGR
jgi:cytochrome c-type biogenesis protein CcmH/NrfG